VTLRRGGDREVLVAHQQLVCAREAGDLLNGNGPFPLGNGKPRVILPPHWVGDSAAVLSRRFPRPAPTGIMPRLLATAALHEGRG
jgi:hypothetical protein